MLRFFQALLLCGCIFGPGLTPAFGSAPASGLSVALQRLLAVPGEPQGLRVAGHELKHPDQLRNFYAARAYQPIWTGTLSQRQRAALLLQAVAAGADHGLGPEKYPSALVESAMDRGVWADAELLLSDVFLRQARHRADGLVQPQTVAPEWYAPRPSTDVLPFLEAAANGDNPATLLNGLWPEEPAYWRLVDARRAFRSRTAQRRQVTIPAGATLRPGMTDPRVPLLRERLDLPGAPHNRYDKQLIRAVRAYQRDTGLESDGLVGPKTLRELNKTPDQRLQQIDANLERWRWLPPTLPPRHIRVNVAAFQLTAFDERRVALQMQVIAGKPERPTPTLQQDLEYLVFNPYWEIPETIAVEDKLPELRRDPSRLASQGVEAAPISNADRNGSMVAVDQIDWLEVPAKPFPYRLRQRPGPANPLGRLKFMLPNDQAVYLHDTPDVRLFNKCQRSFSSGCVRVANAVMLAEWVLQFQDTPWSRAEIEAQITSQETRTVVLDSPIPVFILYLTSYVDESGTLRFHPDLYKRDPTIINALHGAAP